ncbi:hypothetical protein [Isoptericola sp. NPDC057191]|uniref:hypothetical protein n=1 Tax=Isoptericola sp. NPDC057191 TaxID=3346041 RepID=UPI0036341F5D
MVAVALVAVGGAATASAAQDPAEATANLIDEVAPDQGTVVAGTVQGDQVVATAGTAQATIPVDSNQPVALGAPAQGAPLEINLPKEITTQDAQVADDGTVVYQGTGDSADAAVQTLDHGAVRIQTVTQDADGPHEFTYTFGDDITPVLADDGTVELRQKVQDGVVIVIGAVDKPWAADANGAAVPTTYTVEAGNLVQTVAPSGSTAYPVVADPKITFGRNIYINFTRAETRRIAGYTAYGALSSVICTYIPVKWLSAGCLVGIGANAISIDKTFNYAKSAGRCVQIAVAWGIGPLDGNWRQIEWKKIRCLS